ncbi:MAG: hypothetical protein K6B67_00935 [Lachnospiraceae bacterium]|nr:hypothetical protein [Lachnospiraceae bacterium]
MVEINVDNKVLTPSGIRKDELLSVDGFYLSAELFPAKDMFPFEHRFLYEGLEFVDEIDIFGMFPCGDDMIINKLNDKRFIRVFVYNKKTSNEAMEWKHKLKCKYELLDSNDFG